MFTYYGFGGAMLFIANDEVFGDGLRFTYGSRFSNGYRFQSFVMV